jgi:hypothetical protein
MNRSLTISADLYARLETAARDRGLAGIEQLLEVWQANEQERARRTGAVQRIDELRARLLATYGQMADSTDDLRHDRAR